MKLAPLALLLALAGCGEGDHDHGHAPHGGAHRHAAPHGGALIELGEHLAHLEAVHDPATGRLTLYVLDAEAALGVRVQQATINLVVKVRDEDPEIPFNLEGVASAVTGETRTDTSEFTGLSPSLEGVTAFEVRVYRIEVRGQVFQRVSFRYPEGNEE